MTTPIYSVDLAIFGGGIAGLWLLNCARRAGYHAVLLETGDIGGGQTIASQGIIHGGAKYALTGALAQTGHAVADMPAIWKASLEGEGPVDLRLAQLLSPYQYLWSTGKLFSQFASFVASHTLKSDVKVLDKKEYPAVFQNPAFKGKVYQVEEMVLDIPSVLKALVSNCPNAIFKMSNPIFTYAADGSIAGCTSDNLKINARQYVFTAGAGNELLTRGLGVSAPSMQRRPLQMVMVKHTHQLPVYAHCITSANPKPRITITTHTASDGKTVWYLGGLLAETGVTRTAHEQCLAAKKELNDLFPWLDFSDAEWATLNIDRAEPHQDNGQLPGTVFAKAIHNVIVAWPAKLAMAPQLAAEIMKLLPVVDMSLRSLVHPTGSVPKIALPIWETATWMR